MYVKYISFNVLKKVDIHQNHAKLRFRGKKANSKPTLLNFIVNFIFFTYCNQYYFTYSTNIVVLCCEQYCLTLLLPILF